MAGLRIYSLLCRLVFWEIFTRVFARNLLRGSWRRNITIYISSILINSLRYTEKLRIQSHAIFEYPLNKLHACITAWQFTVDSERQIFEKLFMAILFVLWVFARNLLRGNWRRNIFCILALRLISHHTTY